MKRIGCRVGLLAVFAALSVGALAAQDLGPNPWQVEAGAFFGQEQVEDVLGNAVFYVGVLKDVNLGPGGAVTSVGASWLEKSDSGSKLVAGGLFLRQTWYGRLDSGDYGGVFAGFDVGIFGCQLRTPRIDEEGDPMPLNDLQGIHDQQLGVGAGLFVGYTFGERLSIRGGYNVYPSVGATAVGGFVTTVGYKF
jgi:hypothetical protein